MDIETRSVEFFYNSKNGDQIAFTDSEVRALTQLLPKLVDMELFEALTISGMELCDDEAALMASIKSHDYNYHKET